MSHANKISPTLKIAQPAQTTWSRGGQELIEYLTGNGLRETRWGRGVKHRRAS